MITTKNPTVLLTAEGWRRLHDELGELRQRRAEALAETAQVDGGWRPVSDAPSTSGIEYLDHCIAEMEYVLSRAAPVEDEDREPGVVGVGSEVDVVWDDGLRETYVIVGPPEVAPRLNLISYASPVGLALMGRRANDEVTVITESQTSRIRIESVA
jgi:transcription elongation GreA/GreB family factor